jgi:predicted chitinase
MAQLNTIQDTKPRTTSQDRKTLSDQRIDSFDDLIIQEDEPQTGPRPPRSGNRNQQNNTGQEYRLPEIEKEDSKVKGTRSPKGGLGSTELTKKSNDFIKSTKTPIEKQSFLSKAQRILGSDKHTPKFFVQSLPLMVNAPYNIDTPERLSNFMGQCMAESGIYPKTEAMGYRASTLAKVWPNRITLREAKEVVKRAPSVLNGWADIIYGGRNEARSGDRGRGGNTFNKISPAKDGNRGTTEGYTYRGHGLIQSTFKPKFIAFDEKFAGFSEAGDGESKAKSVTGYDDFRPIVQGSDPKNDPHGAVPRKVESGHFIIYPDVTSNPNDPIWAVITSLEFFRGKSKLLVNNVSPLTTKTITGIVKGSSDGYQLRHKWTQYFYNKLKQ